MIGHGDLLREFSFTRPIRGFGHVWEVHRLGMPRRPETRVFLKAAPLSSGRIVPRVAIAPFISRERPNVKHFFVDCLRSPRPTSVHCTGMQELYWHHC